MMDIKGVLLIRFKKILTRRSLLLLLSQGRKLILKTNNWQKNCANQLLENLNEVKYTLSLKTTFWVHIQQICNQ